MWILKKLSEEILDLKSLRNMQTKRDLEFIRILILLILIPIQF